MLAQFAMKEARIRVGDFPIQGDDLASPDTGGGGANFVGCDEIERSPIWIRGEDLPGDTGWLRGIEQEVAITGSLQGFHRCLFAHFGGKRGPVNVLFLLSKT